MLRFGDFTLDPDRRELRQGNALVAVEPQVFDLLVYLIDHRNRVVSKDDLLEAVWGGRIVSESTLTTRINAARRAIGDTGARQEMIRSQLALSRLFGAFGVMSLALCALGMYSVLSYAVSQRLRELGIRVALGATRRRIFLDVLHDGAVLVIAGTASGGIATIWTNRLVDPYIGLLYHVDAVALVTAEAVLVGVALAAMLRPAVRATRADPVEVLRAV